MSASNTIEANGGITGPTGSFQDLFTTNVIKAQGGITGATGSFSYLNSNNLSIYGDGTYGYINLTNANSSIKINDSALNIIDNTYYSNIYIGSGQDQNYNYIMSRTSSNSPKPLIINAGGSPTALYIDTSNNRVGINQAVANYTLDVSGNANVSGNLQINTHLQIQNDGTTGYIHMNNVGSNYNIGSNNQDNIKINTNSGISLESTVTPSNFNLQINDIDTTSNPKSIGFILNGIFNQYNSLISGGESVIMAKTYNNIIIQFI